MVTEVESHDRWLEVKLAGRTDTFNFNETRASLAQITKEGRSLALDVSRTEFLNMQMIKFVHQLALDLREKGGVVALIGATEKLKKQFRVFASLDPIITFSQAEWEMELSMNRTGRA